MHIPDNYLSPQTCAVMTAAMVPVWTMAIKKVKKDIPKEKIPMLGVGAAFSFTGMMFNIPLPGGTTGHAVGGTLNSVLNGPHAACISVTIALLIQALLFGDGGILAFGANCFNMAFVLPYTGYAVYLAAEKLLQNLSCRIFRRKCSDKHPSESSSGSHGCSYVAAGIGSYVGINAAALCTAIEFGVQPMLFTDAAGQPLYCPYGLELSIPAMMIGHLTLFGAAEVVFTTAIYAFVTKTGAVHAFGSADARDARTQSNTGLQLTDTDGQQAGLPHSDCGKESPGTSHRGNVILGVMLAFLVFAVPLGLLASGTAWGEWDVSDVGITENFSFSSLFPDYSIAGLPDFAGYILSAVIGVSLLIIFFRIAASSKKTRTNYDYNE